MKRERGLYLKALGLLLDEVLIAGLILFVLWKLGVSIPFWAFILAGIFCVVAYWLLYRLLLPQGRKASFGEEGMVGLRGKTVTLLNPEGLVRVRGVLWTAVCEGGEVVVGAEVVVVGLDGLRLLVVPQGFEECDLD